MRVTQRTMYSSMSGQMNSLLSDYMESNLQGGTLKKINRPSDDPAGMARILSYRTSIDRSTQYETNADTALGWLQLATGTLGEGVEAAIRNIETLATQAAQGTNAEQRPIIAEQLRQALGQLIGLANTDFEGKHLFAGQDYNTPAFREGLAVTSVNLPDNAKLSPAMQVTGNISKTAMIRFPPVDGSNPPVTGTVPPSNTNYRPDPGNPGGPELFDPAVPTVYEWSDDGGKTWQKGTVPVGSNKLTVGGATITIPQLNADGTEWNPATLDKKGPPNALFTKPYNKDEQGSSSNGTTLFVRPTAIYQGSDNNAKPIIGTYGNNSVPLPPMATTSSSGIFKKDTLVKFDKNIDLTTTTVPPGVPNDFTYTYSTDGGKTWQAGRGTVTTEELSPYVHKYSTATPVVDSDGSPVYLKDGDIVRYPNGDPVMEADGVTPKIANHTQAMTYSPLTDIPAKHQNTARMVVPGGYMDIAINYEKDAIGTIIRPGGTPPGAPYPDATVSSDTQLVMRPQRSDLNYEIMPGQNISVNNIGKDIFGGLYKDENNNYLAAQFGEDEGRNLFETLGRLIGFCETNNSDGIGQAVEDLKLAEKNVLTQNTAIGGKLNRVQATIETLDMNKLDQETRKGNIEDIDITELMVKITQQQMAYNTVLKTSSMIMQMNLMQYL